jgi:hypothetical protein
MIEGTAAASVTERSIIARAVGNPSRYTMRSPNGCTVIAEGSGPKLVCENLPTSDEKQYTARASLDMAAGAPSPKLSGSKDGLTKNNTWQCHCQCDSRTVAPRLGSFFAPFFRRWRRQIAAGADDGGASPTHVLAPPPPPMIRAHPPALPLSIRAVP